MAVAQKHEKDQECNEQCFSTPKHISHLKFCKVQSGTKIAFEESWQDRPYTAAEIEEHVNGGGNYGILSGYGGVVTIDCDHSEYTYAVENFLPMTFSVQSSDPNKRHFLYYVPDFPKHLKKILFVNREGAYGQEEPGGDMRSWGAYTVGPGSLHPNGAIYKVFDDVPIATVSFDEIYSVLGEYFKTSIVPDLDSNHLSNTSSIQNIQTVLAKRGIQLKKNGSGTEIFGVHPIHGSENGKNFWVNIEKNVWCCHRCGSGGDALMLIAVLESIIDCSEAKKGMFKGDKFKEAVQLAKTKYGLKILNGKDGQRKMLTELNLNQIAKQLSEEYKLIYCANKFYIFEDGYYRKYDEHEIGKLIKVILGDSFSSAKKSEVIHSLKMDCYRRPEELNADRYLVNLKNGIFNLRNFRLEFHSEDFLSTIQLPIVYDPEAQCPLWERTLNEIFEGNINKISVLQEFFGYCLIPDTTQEKALFNVGEGRNGKTTVLNTLRGILGNDNCSSIQVESFGNRYYLAQLLGKLVNIGEEIEPKGIVNVANFKAIVSGAAITVDEKYEKPISFQPFARLIFPINTLPRVDDKSDGFSRRIIVLKYDRKFSEVEQDKKLSQKLEQEYSGIFNWMVEGLKRLQERGRFELDVSMKWEAYRIENDSVLGFIKDRCFANSKSKIAKDVLFQAYQSYCNLRGHIQEYHMPSFGRKLLNHFNGLTEDRDSSTRYWLGIGINDRNDTNDAIV